MKEYAYIEGNDYSEGFANGYKKAMEDKSQSSDRGSKEAIAENGLVSIPSSEGTSNSKVKE